MYAIVRKSNTYDCPKLMLNIGDPCDEISIILEETFVTEDCECLPIFDCPDLRYNIGDLCDDGNEDTINDSIYINCECKGENLEEISYFIPNAISLNKSSLNGCLQVYFGKVKPASFEIHIYDKWGTKIFFSEDRTQCWNPKYKGKSLAPGVYVYFVKVDNDITKGDFTILP